jgi:hypothetical protein
MCSFSTRTRVYAVASVLSLSLMGLAGKADAGFTINFSQVGNNVVATGSGTIDTTDLSFAGEGSATAQVVPHAGLVWIGPIQSTSIDLYTGAIVGPTGFGTSGASTPASTGSGDFVGLFAGGTFPIDLPVGYVSGADLSDTSAFSNATFVSMGLTPGTYTYTWGTGADADSLVVNIGVSSVPEPSSLVLCGIAFAGVITHVGRKRMVGRS